MSLRCMYQDTENAIGLFQLRIPTVTYAPSTLRLMLLPIDASEVMAAVAVQRPQELIWK